MKKLNIILAILILLLALGSAVCSYFLFEKRTELVNGWKKLVETIADNSKAMDRNSGTVYSGKASDLSHEDMQKMRNVLPAFIRQAKEIMEQRNNFSAKLAAIAGKTGAGVKEDDLSKVETSAAAVDKVVSGVDGVVADRDKFRSQMNSVAQECNVRFNGKNGEDVRRAVGDMKKQLQRIGNAIGAYDISTVADKVTAKIGEVRKLQGRVSALESDNSDLREQINTKDRTIKAKDNEIASGRSEVAERDNTIRELKRALGVPPDQPIKIWKNGSNEAREHLQGKVIVANYEYGFLVVDFGRQTMVMQQIGNRTLSINPELVSGLSFYIYRGEGAGRKLISTIKLDRIEDDKSTASIPKGDKNIKVGDFVIFCNK